MVLITVFTAPKNCPLQCIIQLSVLTLLTSVTRHLPDRLDASETKNEERYQRADTETLTGDAHINTCWEHVYIYMPTRAQPNMILHRLVTHGKLNESCESV
jgi:hypothetical protein